MKDFEFLFSLLLTERILKHTDNLSRTLQATSMSAIEGHRLSNLIVDVLKGMRSDESFSLFWKYVETVQRNLMVNDPTTPKNTTTMTD